MDRLPNELLDDLIKYEDEALRYGKEYAKAKEVYDLLDKRKDIKKQEIINRQEGKTNAERERMALVCEEWGNYVDNLVASESLKTKWRILLDDAIRRWDTTRTCISSKNAEMRFTSGG